MTKRRSPKAANVPKPETRRRKVTKVDPETRVVRPSDAVYRSLVEHAAFGIVRSDSNGRFVTVNPAIAEMLGYESEAQLMVAVSMQSLHTDPHEHERLMERLVRTDRVKGFVTEWRRKDGTPIAVLLSGRLVRDGSSALAGVEIVIEDASKLRALEIQLRQAQKMEAITHLTAGIAHDFNNLLTVVVSTADLLAEEIALQRPDLTTDLDNLRSAGLAGAEMCRKLIGFSRRGQLVLTPVNLTEVVAKTIAMLRPLLPEHIETLVQHDEVVGTVRADAGAVEQILMNLVMNARDAMPRDGTLRIETRRGWLDETHRAAHGWGDPGEYATLIVSDTGTGMDDETRRRIFEPFFTTKTLGAGTGLGMAMVLGLLKQHEGFVDVYSEPGQGTVVKAYFPVIRGESTVDLSSQEVAVPGGTETILIAEDEAVIRRLAKRILEGLGYRVFEAVNGQKALERIRDQRARIDLVITDIGMPRMSGPAVYRTVRDAGMQMPFLFMSAYMTKDLRESDRLDPALPVLHKPWTLTELGVRVREVLDQASASAVIHGRTILVVDDDLRTRTMIRARLETAGCLIAEAADGASAQRLYYATPTDVVITDLAMPGMGGAELIAELHRHRPPAHVVAISGSFVGSRDELLCEAKRLGAVRALPKPFTTRQLFDAVRAALPEGKDEIP
jgi:PAS domain S-box-containing protein